MKKILIAVIIILVTNSAICQKSTKERYFQVSFFGVDTLGAQRYGTYFFNTKDSYFPTIEEVQKIVSIDTPTVPWVKFLLRKKIIGYDDIIRYLCTDPASFEMASTKKALIETIQQKTRRYAKRQLTFLRMLEKLMRSHVTKPSHMVIITQDHERKVLEQVSEFLCIHK